LIVIALGCTVARPQKSMPKTYTRADVAKHQALDDMWMIIEGKVYDLTKFIDLHPGGEVIMDGAGRDGTGLFEDMGHSSDARAMLKEYYIGDLVK